MAGVGPWNYDDRNSYPSVTDQLAAVMRDNPYLQVLVLGGLRDLACPMDGIRNSLNRLRLDSAYRGNIAFAEFDSGHMMYVNLPDLKKMQGVLEKFISQ